MRIIKVIIFLIFLIYSQVKAMIDVPLEGEAPDYRRLQTIVRLKYAEGMNAAYYSDYKGMEVMFETRDRVTNNLAWAGKVSFRPANEKASPVYELESQVIMSYFTHPQYFDRDRKYSTVDYTYIEKEEDRPQSIDKRKSPMVSTRFPLIIYNLPYIYLDTSSNEHTSYYKAWMYENCIFEWTLGQVYTVTDLKNMIDSLIIDKKFPKYLLYGYSSDGKCLNCVTFSSALLQRVGVNMNASPVIDRYLKDYLSQTWWGFTTSGLRGVAATGAAGFGGMVGFFAVQEAIKNGAIAGGAVGGPVGIAVGAAVGVAVGGIAVYGVGSLAKKGLDMQANIRNAATPELFIDEIYHRRIQSFQIVKTRRNGGIRPRPYKDVGILNVLNRKKFWFQTKVTEFPADITFANYGFNY